MVATTRMMIRAVSLAVIAAATGCSDRAWTKQDSWYRPASTCPPDFVEIDPSRVHEIVEQHEGEALARLEAASCVNLSVMEASNFVGSPVEPNVGRSFYLVRAVYLNRGTGGFYVKVAGDTVSVSHQCLGHRPVPMRRTALIIELERAPREVFVGCGMAE